jgi:Fe-S cluster biogenesis protein NfuA
MHNHHDIQSSLERVESLVREAEELADPAARARVHEIVLGLLEYYGAGLERILELITERGNSQLIELLARDQLISSLLLLHGLHPAELPDRVEQALNSVRPFLQSHGGEVELLDIANGVVHVRLHGSCHGCPSSSITMKTKVEQAIFEAAPDVERVELEESQPEALAASAGFVPLAALTGVNGTG